jgi:hypothetical protein
MLIKRKKIPVKKKKENLIKKIILYFKNISSILVAIQLFVFFLILIFYQSSQLSKAYPPKRILHRINIEQQKATGFDLKNIKQYFIVGMRGLKTKIKGNGFDLLNLSIDQKNLLIIEKQRLIRNKKTEKNHKIINKMARAKIETLDQNYKIKLRVKGVRPLHHYKKDALSYKVDLIGKKRIFGMEEFNLQKPLLRNYSYEYLFHKFQKEVGNISLKYLFKNLSINGSKPSLYVIEEGMSKELIERHNKRNGPILNADEKLTEIFPEHAFEAHSEEYWKNENHELLATAYSVINSFREKDFIYENSFAWKKWARYFAVTDLMESYHGALSKSVNLYFNPVTAKFEPIGYDAHVGAGTFNDFLIFDFLGTESPKCSYICDNKEWFLKFFYTKEKKLREDFVKTYFLTLKEITDKNYLDSFFKTHNRELNKINNSIYAEYSSVDRISWVGIAPFVFDRKKIYDRAEYIKSKIKYVDNYNLSKNERHKYKLSIVNNKFYYDATTSRVPIKVKLHCKNNLENNVWVYGRGFYELDKCEIIKNNIILYDLSNHSISKNLNKIYEAQRGYKPIIFKELKKIDEVVELKKKNGKYFTLKNEIHIRENSYIPKNMSITFKEKNIIYFHNNAILFSEGNINFKGTEKDPVTILGYGKANGSLVHLGGSFKSNNLIIKNLLFPTLPQYTLYSGINLINSKNIIQNTVISNSSSEDAINIINSITHIDKLLIKNSLSDGLDVDGGSIFFSKIDCKNITNDCLDISGNEMHGGELTAVKVGDKGLSVGENSFGRIKKIKISDAEIGLAVKDSSKIELDELDSKKVKLDIAVFNKKLEFGSSKLKINKSLNSYNYLVGEGNELEISGSQITEKLKNDAVMKKLYGNEYGAKTIR